MECDGVTRNPLPQISCTYVDQGVAGGNTNITGFGGRSEGGLVFALALPATVPLGAELPVGLSVAAAQMDGHPINNTVARPTLITESIADESHLLFRGHFETPPAAPVLFTDLLLDAFKHPRCTNCHAVQSESTIPARSHTGITTPTTSAAPGATHRRRRATRLSKVPGKRH